MADREDFESIGLKVMTKEGKNDSRKTSIKKGSSIYHKYNNSIKRNSIYKLHKTSSSERNTKNSNSKATWREKRTRLSYFMHHNHNFHLVITALVGLDVAVILSQLIIEASIEKPKCILTTTTNINYDNTTSNQTSAKLKYQDNYSTMIKVEHVLHYISIGILSVFMLEILVKIFASGILFLEHKFEVVDAVVVSISFFLDVIISNEAVDGAVAVLILVRLWRIFHIVAGVVEAVELKAEEREDGLLKQIRVLRKEIEELKKENGGLKVL